MFAGFAFVVFGEHNGSKVQLQICNTRAEAEAAIRAYVRDDKAEGYGDTTSVYSIWETTKDFLA